MPLTWDKPTTALQALLPDHLDLPEDQRSKDGHTLLLRGFIGAANEDWLALREMVTIEAFGISST